jgi:hypothetical protein
LSLVGIAGVKPLSKPVVDGLDRVGALLAFGRKFTTIGPKAIESSAR